MLRNFFFAVALLAPLSLGAQASAKAEKPDSVPISELMLHTQFLKVRGEGVVKRVYLQWWEGFSEKKLGLSLGYEGYIYAEGNALSGTSGLYTEFFGGRLSFGLGGGGGYGVDKETGQDSVYFLGTSTLYVGTKTMDKYLDLYVEGAIPDRDGREGLRWGRADLVALSGKYFALGGLYQTNDGYGPRAELRIPVMRLHDLDGERGLDIRLWGAPVYQGGTWNRPFRGGSWNFLFGIYLSGTLRVEDE